MTAILATQKAEIRRIAAQSQSRLIVLETYLKKSHHKKVAGGVTQGVGPEFKPQYRQKKKEFSSLTIFLVTEILCYTFCT
jgi:hypothetical protein